MTNVIHCRFRYAPVEKKDLTWTYNAIADLSDSLEVGVELSAADIRRASLVPLWEVRVYFYSNDSSRGRPLPIVQIFRNDCKVFVGNVGACVGYLRTHWVTDASRMLNAIEQRVGLTNG